MVPSTVWGFRIGISRSKSVKLLFCMYLYVFLAVPIPSAKQGDCILYWMLSLTTISEEVNAPWPS